MSKLQNQEPIKKYKQWTFTVSVPKLGANEFVCISGNTPALGEWRYLHAVKMDPIDNTDRWSTSLEIPNTKNVYYRYAICTVNKGTNYMNIQQWETHLNPRVIQDNCIHPFVDTFGKKNEEYNVTKGWLTYSNLLQFQFFNNPMKLKSKLTSRNMFIKVTPVTLSYFTEAHIEDSMSNDNMEINKASEVNVEVSTLTCGSTVCLPQAQDQFGREYKPNDVLLINLNVADLTKLAYLVDFYAYSTRASPDLPPQHIGYSYLLPDLLKGSEGTLELPITCNIKHRLLGTINIKYLIIRPMNMDLCNLRVSYAKYWNASWTGLEVGHRGLGASFKSKHDRTPIRENTVASMKKAAASGADMIEFDVQLSKDLIPVIYHDFHVLISMKRKREVDFSEMLELPVKDLTLEQMQKFKVYHLEEGRHHEFIIKDDGLEEHQPFPTLQHVFTAIEPHVGFNIELKWTMELNDGSFELDNPFDMNLYVDKVLEVVLKYGGHRRIVFSCFNPDICTMVRHKQNKYAVLFLTQGETTRWQPYRDPRCLSVLAAVTSALNTDILGVCAHSEELLRDPTKVKLAKDTGLVLFCWGDDNNNSATIQQLKDMGLHAVIYDKLDQYTTKQIKESIFMMDPHHSDQDLGNLAASPVEVGSVSKLSARSDDDGRVGALALALRHHLQQASTATSLVSLASSIHLTEPNLKRTLIHAVPKDTKPKDPCGGALSTRHDTTPKRSRSNLFDLNK